MDHKYLAWLNDMRKIEYGCRLIDALEFYADTENWKDAETGIGCHPGEAVDYGARAREALHPVT